MDMEAFGSKPSVKVVIKTTSEVVNVICSTEYEQSDWESTRRSFKSVRSYEEIHATFDSKGGRRPQRSISTTVNGDCWNLICINVRRTALDGRDRNGDRHRNTSLTVEVD